MTIEVTLRTGRDRLRYSFMFEASLMVFLIPAGAVYFDKAITDIGALAVVLSFKAVLVSLIYNWSFDRHDARRGRASSDRAPFGRILHAVGFEVMLLFTSLPIYIFWLGLTVFEAFATDLVVTSFVVVYTYVFTLGYDRVFPVHSATGDHPEIPSRMQ